MPVDLYRLSEGWLELESDPGVFTLLLEDFGCRDIQIEEIYDLAKPIEGTVYGFIFLFKWIEERRSRWRQRTDHNNSGNAQSKGEFIENESIVNDIFFAQQMVPNSCATHALLSVLLNCPKIHLGPVLERLQYDTRNMSPENKGYAIGNSPELARAHNSHAPASHDQISVDNKFSTASRPANHLTASSQRSAGLDAFHFVSYVPINDRLIELDGLKRYPIDHGSWGDNEYWTEKFRRVIRQRLERETQSSEGQTHDIRYNLMAVVPDRRINYLNKLRILKTNRHIVLEALQQLTRPTRLPTPLDYHNYSKYPDITVKPQDELLNNDIHKNNDVIHEPLMISIDDNVRSDLQRPLTIQTSVSPTPSSSSSTDTSSEIGSAFNSPNNSHCETDERINQMIVCKMMSRKMCGESDKNCENLSPHNIATQSSPSSSFTAIRSLASSSCTATIGSLASPSSSSNATNPPSTAFTAKDLLFLLKKLENDINLCETNLNDELEKRRKYRIDDSRRIHNYDQFIMTFLAMLSERGKLAELVEKDLGMSTAAASGQLIESPPSSPSNLIQSLMTSFSNYNDNDEEDDDKKKRKKILKHVKRSKKIR